MTDHLVVGVALDGVGAHASAWRRPGALDGLRGADRLVDMARTVEAADLDLVSLDDSFDPSPPGMPALPGLDAGLALARVAPVTQRVGLLATVTTTHTEPFHISKNIATLDLVSGGRAGWSVRVSTSVEATRRFGRKGVQDLDDLYAEAEDAIEVVTRLWDSWEDDAVIRDVATGRYVDRKKLHYIDFEGPFFRVRGPSITPRPPQGQPLIAVDADSAPALALAARRADIVIVGGPDLAAVASRGAEVRRLAEASGRDPHVLTVLAAVRVSDPFLRTHLDDLGPSGPGLDLVGRGDLVAEQLAASCGGEHGVDGFLVSVDLLPDGLEWFVTEVASRWRAAGLLGGAAGGTLRHRLGLARPANRYATVEARP